MDHIKLVMIARYAFSRLPIGARPFIKNRVIRVKRKITLLPENLSRIKVRNALVDLIAKESKRCTRFKRGSTILSNIKFGRIEVYDNPNLLLRKVHENLTIEVHYKFAELKGYDYRRRVEFTMPYVKLIKQKAKEVELNDELIEPTNILPLSPSMNDILYDAIDKQLKEIEEKPNPMYKKVKVDFLFVIRDKKGGGIVADCSTSDMRLTIRTVTSTKDVDGLKDQLRGVRPLTEDLGPEVSGMEKELANLLIRYLVEHGLKKSLLEYIECSAVQKEYRLYVDWLRKALVFFECIDLQYC
eukprot:TRINITY_DN9847_c0_g1_i4.p1 TRINITY_DN9847_c0_g1~~TRINITY_DN9847_c0_g1_i4.p1  ORF type:complete len:299 (-),score=62.46 TRINITY_DN9847_c0_g1_i4:94-990(-)